MPPPTGPTPGPSIDELTSAYRRGDLTPTQVVRNLLASIDEHGADGTWICVASEDDLLLRAAELEAHASPHSLPLFGVPFAVKDSIDVAGVPTTVACPEYAYVASDTAPAVARLLEAGAIYVGKTDLDQFATGLTGTRTPHPIPRSVYGGDLVSGGSSSGSARAVATGQVPFALATDTAGSGRVPPALNGIVGFKPSRGLVSTVGLVPACRSLDCISVVAGRVADLATVLDIIAAVDRRDPASRPRARHVRPGDPRVGLPDPADLDFFGDLPMRDAHTAARAEVARRFATTTVPLAPFLDAGALLYDGPWVAERVTEFGDFLATHPEAVHPVVRSILEAGRRFTATDVFSAQHRLGELRAQVAAAWDDMDVLVLPAVGTTFTVAEVLADPVRTNTALGHYTHFGNLLDLCAAVVPAGLTSDGRPAALMVLGPALSDDLVLAVAAALAEPARAMEPTAADAVPSTAGSPSLERRAENAGTTTLVVVGHHLAGQPRSADLTRLGGVLAEAAWTAAEYRLLRVGGADPVPALLRVGVAAGGRGIAVETWTLPAAALAEVLATAAPVLCLGRVLLADGRSEIGFVADAAVVAGDVEVADISEFGGWRAYLAARSLPQPVP